VNKRQITDLVDQSIQINAHCFVVTADNRYILICGFWDKSFRVYSTETGNLHNEGLFSVFKRTRTATQQPRKSLYTPMILPLMGQTQEDP
jgi:hypothetical protein